MSVLEIFLDIIVSNSDLILESVVPFFFIFSIIYITLYKTNVFGEKAHKTNVLVSIIFGLVVVINHLMSSQFDIVPDMLALFSPVAMIVIAATIALFIIGIFGGTAKSGIMVVLTALILFFFFSPDMSGTGNFLSYLTLGRIEVFSQILDTTLGLLIFFILVFALITWFVTRPGEE